VQAPRLEDHGQRALGAYFTGNALAQFAANWALDRPGMRVLEPSMGDGSFVRAALAAQPTSEVHGAELASDTFAKVQGLLAAGRAHLGDFLEIEPFEVDAVIGNPPFVRLRSLPDAQASAARQRIEQATGQRAAGDGSTWLAFTLHAMRFLAPGGRMALVLPFEATYVVYGRQLWTQIGERFGSVRILRCRERLFAGILQECVLVMADDFGASCTHASYEASELVEQLLGGAAQIIETIELDDLCCTGRRPLMYAHLPDELRTLLDSLREQRLVSPLGEQGQVRIGYVSGDREFFHPSPEQIARYDIPASLLRPALTASRQLRGAGIDAASIHADLLLDTNEGGHLPGNYLEMGEQSGVAARYKCRTRSPWHAVPGLRVPDFVLPVFGDCPLLMTNSGGYLASNSLLCVHDGPNDLLGRWYSSLTLLMAELNVHSLGGGVLILVPREAAAMELPTRGSAPLALVDQLVRAGRARDAFALGDDALLAGALGLTPAQIELVRAAAIELRRWRLR
jgi:adenine-specific DNA-methyltransferase